MLARGDSVYVASTRELARSGSQEIPENRRDGYLSRPSHSNINNTISTQRNQRNTINDDDNIKESRTSESSRKFGMKFDCRELCLP